jgi:ankyrin repeat protein
LLLEHAEDNPADNAGMTPLHIAAINNQLLEHAKDKNPENKNGKTPLHLSEQQRHFEIVKLIKDFNKD